MNSFVSGEIALYQDTIPLSGVVPFRVHKCGLQPPEVEFGGVRTLEINFSAAFYSAPPRLTCATLELRAASLELFRLLPLPVSLAFRDAPLFRDKLERVFFFQLLLAHELGHSLAQ